MELLRQTFRKKDDQDRSATQEHVWALVNEIKRIKEKLYNLKNDEEAELKINETTKNIEDFMTNCGRIELQVMNPMTRAKHLQKCLECVLYQLEEKRLDKEDMYNSLLATVLNLDGVAQVFVRKEEMKGKSSLSVSPRTPQQQLQTEKENSAILASKITELEEKLRKETAVKEDALRRLSELAGDRMRTGNPNICDLSDPNRPLKLAEIFGEIYCNEWTDALESLQQRATGGKSLLRGSKSIYFPNRQLENKESDSIKTLFDVLKNCYEMSQDAASRQRAAILAALTDKNERDIEHQKYDLSKTLPATVGSERFQDFKPHLQKKDTRTDNDHRKLEDAIREFQRHMGTETVKVVPQIVSRNVRNKYVHHHGDKDKMLIYVDKCAELCWLMMVQFPPIHLDFDIKMGTQFDSRLYRQYVHSGNKVMFPVWPVMYLTDNKGPVLGKGVVECVPK